MFNPSTWIQADKCLEAFADCFIVICRPGVNILLPRVRSGKGLFVRPCRSWWGPADYPLSVVLTLYAEMPSAARWTVPSSRLTRVKNISLGRKRLFQAGLVCIVSAFILMTVCMVTSFSTREVVFSYSTECANKSSTFTAHGWLHSCIIRMLTGLEWKADTFREV